MPTATKTPPVAPAASKNAKALSPLQVAGVIYGLGGLVSLIYVLLRLSGADIGQLAEVWLKIAYGYWVLITFTGLQIGAGHAVMNLTPLRQLNLWPRWLWDFAAGLFVSYIVLMVLALAGTLAGAGIAIYAAAIGALAAVGCRQWVRSRSLINDEPVREKGGQQKQLRSDLRRYLWLGLALIAAIWLLPYFIQTLLPNTDWDTASAHLPLAERFLHGGIWDVDPIRFEFNVPGAAHLVYALMLGIGAESAIIPLNFSIALWLMVTVYAFASSFWGRAAGLWSVLIAAATNLYWEVSFGARIDLFLAFFCLLGVFAFFLWMRDRQNTWLPIVGAMLGLAAGVKYTAAPLIALLGGFGLVLGAIWFWRSPRSFLVGAAVGTILLLIPSSFWYVRNQLVLDNMIYPLNSPWLYENAAGQIVPLDPDLETVFAKYPDTTRLTEKLQQAPQMTTPGSMLNLWDVYLNPNDYERKKLHFITPVLLLFFALPLVRWDRASLVLFGIALVTFYLIAQRTYIIRYAIHVLPLMAIGAGLVISQLQSRRFAGGRLRPLALALAAGLVVVDLVALNYLPMTLRGGFPITNSRYEWAKLELIAPAAYLSGAEDELTWLSAPFTGYNGATTMPELIQPINAVIAEGRIDPKKTVLMIGEGKGWLLDMPFLPDSSREGLPWLAELARAGGNLDQVAANLNREGIGYLLLNVGYFDWVAEAVPGYDRRRLATTVTSLKQFMQSHARPIYTSPSGKTFFLELK